MKIVIPLALVICSAAFSQPQTFRSMSTGGMIQDDLDLWYSGMLYLQPVAENILDAEGVRVYTGLSNLANGSDMVFQDSDSTRGGFLLGGSLSPAGSDWGVGILAEFMDERTYDDVSLPGPGGSTYLTGEGKLEGTWSEFQDTDGDGILDSRHTVYQSTEGRTDSSLTSAGLYGAYRLSETTRLGLGIAWLNTETETLDPADNGTISVTDSNIVTGVETYDLESTSTGKQTESRNGLVISASGTGELNDAMDLGVMLQFASVSSEFAMDLSNSGSEDYLPGVAGQYDLSTWNGVENISVAPSGSRLGGGLNFKYAIDDQWRLESSAGYYTLGLSGSSDQYNISMDSSYILTTGSLTDSTLMSMNGGGSTDIDLGDDLLAMGVKLTFDPSNSMVISLGAGFHMHELDNTVTNHSQNTQVVNYSDGDTQFADPDDYVSTSTWSQTQEQRTTSSTSRISVPVGLEFQVLPRLTARLGASPGFVWEKTTDRTSLLDASPVVTHTVYGDGTEDQTVESPYQTDDGTLIETDQFYTDIPFSYGVGFSPDQHMQIDLMGLGKDLDQWRLSATLLF